MSCGFCSHVSGPDAAWGYGWPAHPSVACGSTSFATPGAFDDFNIQGEWFLENTNTKHHDEIPNV